MDECAGMPNACSNGRCVNTAGSYYCVCDLGYKVDLHGTSCVDDDECARDPRPCEHTCRNLFGSFVCSCPQGFVLNSDALTCRDVDECATMRHDCPHLCINTPGSYECGCPEGHRQTRGNCVGMYDVFNL